MTVETLSQSIGTEEFTGWQAYYRVCPFGEDRLELAIARLAALTFNQHRSKDQSPAKCSDYQWNYQPEKAEPTPEEIEADIDAAFGAMMAAPAEVTTNGS